MLMRYRTLLSAAFVLASAAVPARAQIKPDTEFRVKLLAPLSTETNQKGDKITAQVLAPQDFAGGMMEGEVRQAKSGGKLTGKSTLTIGFSQLVHGGKQIPIQAQVKSFANSKGQRDVDEEGRVVESRRTAAKTAAGAGIGALIGAVAGGAKGAAIGAIGGAAALILVQVAGKGPNITFAPGSEIFLTVSEGRKSADPQKGS